MGHEHVYGICENKCMVEVPTKKETPYVENEESELQQNVIIQQAGKWFDDEHELSRIYIPTNFSDWIYDSETHKYVSETAIAQTLFNKIDWSKIVDCRIKFKMTSLSIDFFVIENLILIKYDTTTCVEFDSTQVGTSQLSDMYIIIEAVLTD